MLIDRKLAHKLQTKLTEVLCLIDLDRREDAKREVRTISGLITSYVESPEEERVRKEKAERE